MKTTFRDRMIYPCPRFNHPHSSPLTRIRCIGKLADKKLRGVFLRERNVLERPFNAFPGVHHVIGNPPLEIVRFNWTEIARERWDA